MNSQQIEELIETLQLEPDSQGYYHTSRGIKSKEGLIKVIQSILSDENKKNIFNH